MLVQGLLLPGVKEVRSRAHLDRAVLIRTASCVSTVRALHSSLLLLHHRLTFIEGYIAEEGPVPGKQSAQQWLSKFLLWLPGTL